MSQSQLYLAKSQNWSVALRLLMGYPVHGLQFHTVSWCSSGPLDMVRAAQVTQVVADSARDLVHIACSLDADEPLGVALAVRRDAGVAWLPNCRLYAASETAPLELLTRDTRWGIGPRHILTSGKLPPKARRDRNQEIAWRRWRDTAAAVAAAGLELQGSVRIPQGGSYADAVPHGRLRAAA